MSQVSSHPPISERVYAAVKDIAAERGIPRLPADIAANVSVSEVARRLGMARSTVRRPFEDWREMAQNVRWRDGLAIISQLEGIATSSLEASSRFVSWWDRVVQPDSVAFPFEEDTIPQFYEDGLENTLLTLLADGTARGEFTMPVMGDVSNMVVHLLRGLALEARNGQAEIVQLTHYGDARGRRRTVMAHLNLLLSLMGSSHRVR